MRLRRQPSPYERRPRLLAGIARDLVLLALTRPARIRPLLRAVRNPLRPSRWKSRWATLSRLRSYLPLARVSPDIVHFEWNSAAIHYLPLTDVWRCPAVISCHGSGVNVRPHTSRRRGVGPGASRPALRGPPPCTACPRRSRERAEAFGMDPGQAWLIRPAVDPEVFEPQRPLLASGRRAPGGRPWRTSAG